MQKNPLIFRPPHGCPGSRRPKNTADRQNYCSVSSTSCYLAPFLAPSLASFLAGVMFSAIGLHQDGQIRTTLCLWHQRSKIVTQIVTLHICHAPCAICHAFVTCLMKILSSSIIREKGIVDPLLLLLLLLLRLWLLRLLLLLLLRLLLLLSAPSLRLFNFGFLHGRRFVSVF